MSTAGDRCGRARAAAQEVVMQECEGEDGQMVEVAEDVFVFVREDSAQEFEFDLNSPETDDEFEEAIVSCMDSEWARDWSRSVLGPDAPDDALEQAKRRACEGLFS